MPWARIDDTLYDHPKVDALGKDRLPALGLMALALSWCNRYLTDGFVPTERVARLGGTRRLAELLCTVGLWDRVDDGYRIHDFLHYSKSRTVVERERLQARERQAKSRRDGDESHAVTNDELTPKSPLPRTRTRNPYPKSSSSKPQKLGEVLREIADRAG